MVGAMSVRVPEVFNFSLGWFWERIMQGTGFFEWAAEGSLWRIISSALPWSAVMMIS